MAEVSALPTTGGVIFDARDDGRTLRVGWHPDDDLVVLSIWRRGVCAATCHMTRADAAALVADLAHGLAAPAVPWSAPTAVAPRPSWWRTLRSGRTRLRAVD